jgi:hypothetical protein
MPTPSTTSYYPFNSDAPAVFSQTQTTNYCIVAFLGGLLYDHIITLDKEVEWIWTLRWRLPKIIFIFNRYVITLLFLLNCIPDLIFPVPISFCRFHFTMSLCLSLLSFGTAELLLIIRVCSLYGHRKSIVWPLGGFFVLAFIGAIVSQTFYDRHWQQILYFKFLPGCWAWTSYSHGAVNQWPMWAIFLSVEGVLMLLTIYKLLSYRNQLNPTITVLARDSLVYFVIIFACLASIVATDVEGNILISTIKVPTQCITSVAVGRMMMNIRGLILDDPEHTVHLQTMQFTTSSNSGAEIEEVA